MENNILSPTLRPKSESWTWPGGAVDRAVDRGLARRREVAAGEVERLIEATFRVIERTGELEPKVSEILAEAGLSNPAFYRHFRGKRELLVSVLDEGIRGLGDYLERRMSAAPSPEYAVREWIQGMAAQALDPQSARASRPFALGRGRLAEAFPEEVARSERRLTEPFARALAAARAAGGMPGVDPETEAETIYHLMMGWVEARLIEGRTPAPHEVERLEAFVIAGLKRPAEASLAMSGGAASGRATSGKATSGGETA